MGARRRSGGGEATAVFIVASSDVVRAGLASLVDADPRFTLVGSGADLTELDAEAVDGPAPDVVVLDLERQPEEALDALHSFADETEEYLPTFVVIGAEQREAVAEALRGGVVRALLPRAATADEIIAAVEAVSAGLVALDAEAFAALLPPPSKAVGPSLAQPSDEPLPPLGPQAGALTPREREVLGMLAAGLSNKEIAWRMKISEHTVKFHVASIFAKLDVSTRAEAVTQGIRRGLIMM